MPGGELSGRELSMGGSTRGGKRRVELPGGEVSGHQSIISHKTKNYTSVNLASFEKKSIFGRP